MIIDEEFRAQLMATFREEAAQNLDELAGHLEVLRSGKAQDVPDILQSVFRIAHNLKGASATVEIEAMADLMHALEDAFSPLRDSGQAPVDALIQAALEAVALAGYLAEGESRPRDTERVVQNLSEATQAHAASAQKLEDTPRKKPPKRTRRAKTTRRKKAQEDTPSPSRDKDKRAVRESTNDQDPASPSDGGSAVLRIEAGRLDRLMAHAGELLVTRARLGVRAEHLEHFQEQFQKTLKRLPAASRSALGEVNRDLGRLTDEHWKDVRSFGHLADEIASAMKRVRMLPIRNVMPVWRRIVRDSAVESGKLVELTIEGEEIELDKHVLDSLREPLMHLLRNAVDHGIEASSDRAAAGKSEIGTIRIRASHQGGMVQLEVSDDGHGLDPDSIGKMAVRKGLVNTDQLARMSDEDIVELLFHAGFSTARRVSRLSGRGVGLDVVRQRLEELGGAVRPLSPGKGAGARFLLTVPLSLLSMEGLLVRSAQSVCAFPIDYVDRTFRFDRESLQQVDGEPAVVLEGDEPLKIRFLSSILGQQARIEGQSLSIVILSRSGVKLGVVVSEVLSEEEFVTRRLPWNLSSLPGVSGAVILADGTLAVVMDVPHIYESGAGAQAPILEAANGVPEQRSPRVLVVDDSLTSRTLERNILTRAGYEVMVAVDGEEAWELLQKERFDLLVSDVQMPRLGGIELTRRIRTHGRLRSLPVVLVSGLGTPDDLAQGAEAGADEYIVKSQFDQKKLLEAVTRLI